MKINLSILSKKLAHHHPKIYINKENITTIRSIKYLDQSISVFDPNTLYIGETSSISISTSSLNQANFLIVSEVPIPKSFMDNTNINLIFITGNCVPSVFNEILDIFSECEKLTDGSSKLLGILSQNKGIQQIINTGFELIGNPIFIRDISFNILAFTENIVVDDRIWIELTTKGYQPYNGFQYLMKNGFMDFTNKIKVPVYFKNVDSIKSKNLQEKVVKIGIDETLSFILKPTFYPDSTVSLSRIWSNICVGNKIIGQVVVLEAFKSFSEIDIVLIKKLSDTISLEMQKHKYYENLSEGKQDLLIMDLLDGKIKDKEILDERLKFINWNYKNPLRIITIATTLNTISNIPLKYVSGFFQNVFSNALCILYDGYIIGVFSCNSEKELSDSQLKNLTQFMQDTGTFSGFSRPFYDLLNIRIHYEESLKAIESGKHLKDDQVLFFYDDYILQHIFSLCSGQKPLKEFCLPSIFTLINYDNKNGTNYIQSLYSYIMKFKSPSELAASMHVHRNTLYYRISKIEDIMNIDLNNVDDFFSIYLSFKILEYLGEDLS